MSLAGSTRQLAASLVLGGRQRLELAALDVEEEILRAGCTLASMMAVAVFAALALAALAGSIVVLLWDRAPVAALLGTFATFGFIAALLAYRLANGLRAKPPFMRATLDELGKDAQWLEEQRA
jgi:uncharacterized membrane protein YqjE